MKKGQGRNNEQIRHEQMKEAFIELLPPNGLKFATQEHWKIWHMFTSRRLPSDWHDAELCLVEKLVHNEYNLRRYYKQLDKEGATVKNRFGDSTENPILRSIDRLTRLSMTLQGRLGICQNMNVNAQHDRAKAAHQAKEIAQGKKDKTGKVSMLASAE